MALMRVVPVAALVLLPGLPGALQRSPAGSILIWPQFAAPPHCRCDLMVTLATASAISTLFSGLAPRPIVTPSPAVAMAIGGAPPPAAPAPADSRKQRRRDVA